LSRRLAARGCFVLLLCFLASLAIFFAYRTWGNAGRIVIALDHNIVPANGSSSIRLRAEGRAGGQPAGLTWRLLNGHNLAQLESSKSEWRLRVGVTPGIVTLAAFAPGYQSSTAELRLGLDPTDEFGDGTPDFLRLQSEGDRIAFRHWFAFLAESVYFEGENDRPEEVDDCAALIRFAYREALRKHDASWANQWHLAQLPTAASVRKYEYPHTALGAGLFRTRLGAFTPADLTNGAFAEFADADALRRYNTHFVSRDPSAARPGDLLFFRQQGHRTPFHTIIYLGESSFSPGSNWLIYHTGPDGKRPGEIRRVTVTDLQQHPEFKWRPVPQNPAFLGVYRWNILREED
jgi:uncharacterized protein YfaT (DUF1175 family)